MFTNEKQQFYLHIHSLTCLKAYKLKDIFHDLQIINKYLFYVASPKSILQILCINNKAKVCHLNNAIYKIELLKCHE